MSITAICIIVSKLFLFIILVFSQIASTHSAEQEIGNKMPIY